MNILAIGAHPDDIELGCGGTLLKAARDGHKVFLYVITRGGASGNPEERTQELFATANYLGAQKLWVDNFGDTKVQVGSKLINHIEFFIHESSADLVFTHSLQDYHHDHRAIAEATIEASRFSQNVLAYEVPLTKEFKPLVYCDISDVIDEKIELIRMFRSQNGKQFTSADAVRGLAQYRAFQARLASHMDAVESFEVLKLCFGTDFGLLKLPAPSLTAASKREIDIDDLIVYSSQTRRLIEKKLKEGNVPGEPMITPNRAE